jgi:hypothetical protein
MAGDRDFKETIHDAWRTALAGRHSRSDYPGALADRFSVVSRVSNGPNLIRFIDLIAFRVAPRQYAGQIENREDGREVSAEGDAL